MIHVTFYTYGGPPSLIHKNLSNGYSTTAELYDNTDIFNPELKLAWDNNYATTYNYFYIQEFNRYYFLDDVIAEPGGAARVKGSIDVLYTYRTSIGQDEVVITRAYNSKSDAPNIDAGGTSWNQIPIMFQPGLGPTYVKDNKLPLKPNRNIKVYQFEPSTGSPFILDSDIGVIDDFNFFVLNIMGRYKDENGGGE